MVNMGMKVPARTYAYGVPAKATGEVPQDRNDIIELALFYNIMMAQEYKEQGL
jgi:hypothetical protein